MENNLPADMVKKVKRLEDTDDKNDVSNSNKKIQELIQKAKSLCREKKLEDAYNLVKDWDNLEGQVDTCDFKIQEDFYVFLANFYTIGDLKTRKNYAKTKTLYRKIIDKGSARGAYEFACDIDTSDKESLLYLKEKFPELDDGKQPSCYYAEYGRMYKCIYNIDNNTYGIDLNQILDLYKKSISKNENQSSAYLYLARLYRDCGDLLPQEDPNVSNTRKAEEYYTLSAKKGSMVAKNELDKLFKKQDPELSFDLMNTSENLEMIISHLTKPVVTNNFSMLLSGPRGCGKEVFAEKVMKAVQCNYEVISILDFTNASNIHYRDKEKDFTGDILGVSRYLENKKGKGIVLLNFDRLISKKGEEYMGSIATLINVEAIITAVKNNKFPVILIVDNTDDISQDLRNAFMFRIHFNCMDNPQKEAAYNLFFNFEAPAYLRRLGGLVVDDFSRIRKKAKILNILDNSEKILALLEDEAKYKAGGSSAYLKPDTSFDFSLVNSDLNLIELTEKLKAKGPDKPFSMIIYGPPGTGKSYYLRHLADQIGVSTMEVTAADLLSKWAGETPRNIVNMFKEAENRKAMIIIDEIEMLIKERDDATDYRNDIVNAFLTGIDAAKYPFTCTTNYIEKVDKAALRRFVFKTKFDYLTKEQNDIAFKHFFKFDAPPELSRVGGLTNGDYSTVKKKAIILEKMSDKDALLDMLREESKRKGKAALITDTSNVKSFDTGFINTDTDMLNGFLNNIKKENRTNFSFLLYGPSGTGKSLYLRHIADMLGYEIIERRASDINSKWHGETSKNIAEAFKEAKERKAFLVFDEIDGILYNKGTITAGWQAEQINEFLVQMENHDYPFAGTTNYIDHIEPAALRRFSVKALFDYLKPEQYEYVYEKTFRCKPFKDITSLRRLTPALFNNAKTKVELSEADGNEEKIYNIFIKEAEIAGNKTEKEEDRSYDKIIIPKKDLYTQPIADMYNEVLKGFVKIINNDSHGSGFFISADGFILTNKHVVRDNKFVDIELFTGRRVPGEVLRTNSVDVALIKISEENLCVPMPLRMEEPNPGTTVFSMGNPHDKDQVLTKGTITRYTTNTDGKRRIESDVLTRGGVSGGPLMDEHGNVLGLNVEGWLDRDSNYHTKMGLAMEVPIIDALEALNIKIKE